MSVEASCRCLQCCLPREAFQPTLVNALTASWGMTVESTGRWMSMLSVCVFLLSAWREKALLGESDGIYLCSFRAVVPDHLAGKIAASLRHQSCPDRLKWQDGNGHQSKPMTIT